MLIFTIDNGNGPVDYSQYVAENSIQIVDSINVPSLLTLTLSNTDNVFQVPKQSGYVTLYSTKYGRSLFTGFITNETEKSFLGLSQRVSVNNFQHMEYKLQATSDEWLLNVKSVPFLPAFVSQTMGQILGSLAQTLAPDFFDISNIDAGDIVPYFNYNPTQKWSDLAKTFGDQARMRYKVMDRKIFFKVYGDAPFGISYDDTIRSGLFDPGALQTQVLTVPPVNDAIVVGDIEPQTMWDDYFIGDGFTTNFPLRHQVFEGGTNLLLQDDWTENTFSSSWTKQDPQGIFTLAGGLNAFGVTGSLGNSYLLLNNGLELGGHLSLQHGYFTFTDLNTGLIGAVFQNLPFDLSVSGNCFCAFQPVVAAGDILLPSPSGATNLSIQGLVNGTPVGLPQPVNIASDTFNRGSLGANWAIVAAFPMQINASTTVEPSVTGNNCSSYWTQNSPFPADQYSTIQLAAASGNSDYFGVTVRTQPPALTYYYYQVGMNGVHQLLKVVAGVYTYLGLVNPGPIPKAGDSITLQVIGSNLYALLNSAVIISAVDTSLTYGQPGITAESSELPALMLGDNWSAGSLSYALVKTKQNHQYLLTTRIDAQRYTRYNQIYRGLDTVFGNFYLPSLANVTFQVSDYDMTLPWNPPTVTSLTVSGVSAPSFGQYVLLDPAVANLALNYTLLSQPPQALLHVASLFGPTGSSLPILPSQLGPDTYYQMGFGMSLATATIYTSQQQSGGTGLGSSDQLGFFSGYIPYTNDIPGVGARIALTSWESAKALARVQDPDAIATQAVISGDDGLRTAIFTDLSPLPRTSEEAEYAAMAQIADKSNVQYNGSYSCYDLFWNSGQDYPWTGRYLTVNSPTRNILNQNLFVQQVTTTVVEMFQEILQFQINFGQDLFLEKLLRRFISTPANTLEPNDTAIQPTLQYINNVGLTYLPDLISARASHITGTQVTFDLGSVPSASGDVCEVRLADWGWGVTNSNLVGRFPTQQFTVTRGARDQTFYMRNVNGSGQTSRFTRAMRILYPLIPTAPVLEGIDETDPTKPLIELGFSGDINNIRGIEVRDFDNVTVLEQTTVLSPADLNFTYNNQFGLTTIVMYVYFFNLQWEYSPPLVINLNIGNPLVGVEQAGPNLIGNPGFESESLSYANILAPGTGQQVADNWAVTGTNQFVFEVETNGSPRTGQRCGLAQLKTSASIGASGTAEGLLVTPFLSNPVKGFPVRGGDYYYFGGYVSTVGTALPAGVVADSYFQIMFYDTNGNFLTLAASSVEVGNASGGYVFLDGTTTVPTAAAFMQFACVAVVRNNNSSVFSMGAVLYDIARFDDVFVFKAIRSTHSSYRPLSNPLTAMDDGTYPEIDVASFTMQSGNTQVLVNAGSISGAGGNLAYATTYFVYYDDPAFIGGNVTYNATLVREVALLGESRYFVGSIRTPGAGGLPTIGNNDGGAGAQYSRIIDLWPTGIAFSGPVVNAQNLLDTTMATYASFAVSGGVTVALAASGFPALGTSFATGTLHIPTYFPEVGGGVSVEYSLDGGNSFYLARQVQVADTGLVDAQIPLPPNQATNLVNVLILAGSAGPSGGPIYASGVVDNAGIGDTAWNNPSNAEGNGSTPATISWTSFTSSSGSHYLVFTGYTFNVLPGTSVQGVKVQFRRNGTVRSDSNGLENYIGDNSVKLVKGGVIQGIDHADGSVVWGHYGDSGIYGSAMDTWGLSFTPADINSGNFGAAISAFPNQSISGSVSAQMYSCAITIYFSSGGSGATVGRVYSTKQEFTL